MVMDKSFPSSRESIWSDFVNMGWGYIYQIIQHQIFMTDLANQY